MLPAPGLIIYRDARSARKPRAGKRVSTAQGLVQGEASVSSGRQTDYRRKAGRRVNVDMGQSMGRLDGSRGGSFVLLSY